jgi:hypothetical protein
LYHSSCTARITTDVQMCGRCDLCRTPVHSDSFAMRSSTYDLAGSGLTFDVSILRTPRIITKTLYYIVPTHTLLLRWPKWGGIWYFDIPSPNTTVFSILWPPSIALWGSLVPPVYLGGAIRSIYRYLNHLFMKNGRSTGC